jgi:rhodanese-related sulfurtransferase
MKCNYLGILFLLMSNFSSAQYKNDNVLFKTVDPAALYKTLQNTKGYVLLDVRSSGEFEDTSSFLRLNLGHLKGAINIDVSDLGKRLNELDKSKPIFVYCSHSQRSRNASKMLADSGFTNITNVNGGLTSLHYFGEINKPYFKDLYQTNNTFSFISPKELCDQINNNRADIFLLDVRTDSLFKHISPQPKENAIGNIKGAVNIPYNELKDHLSKVPTDKQVILTDLFGNDAAKAAALLAQNGYKNVRVLIEGVDRWITMNSVYDAACKNLYQPGENYTVVSAIDFGKMNDMDGITILDVRSVEEFNGTHKDSWRNIGKMKNAINIPAAAIEKNIAMLGDKNNPIVVYHFAGGPEAFAAAKYLSNNGFKNVTVLYGGVFSIRWTAANINGQSHLNNLVTDIPDINK